ncbi:hypothetical protein B0H67DRAFT_595483 [Lasiosphaeris hirsuta]|uniref:SMODS and SLOG-associating 2TM effector domain-containing protein n=1 Tax=Lasiosphaeris hirsuta TaxID=260670 RepID=A0AA40DI93_9PEZI|nr:hypothetical protein B0H67DRAFT_595483 [Lasiosphaeris hirsuta]
MASFIHAAMRLAGAKRRQPEQVDEERARVGSVTISETLGGDSWPRQGHGQTTSHPVASDDPLTLFRLMLGITTPAHLASESGARPADNIGLYARVVHSEEVAKDSYKVFSAIINACYFLQIIVAAALTALGAANADNKAITAFGAINTVIAGFLTYLKGSGLPARLKYFGNEWKKVREFIEQQERDFSHEGCTRDVYEVVETIREMYINTKRDIEMNTPDSYNSMASIQARSTIILGGKDISTNDTKDTSAAHADDVASKLRTLNETVRKLKTRVETTVHDVQDGVHAIRDDEKRAVAELRTYGSTVVRGVDERVRDEEKRVAADARSYGTAVIKRLDEQVRDEERKATTELRGYGNAAARGVDERVREEEQRVAAELRNYGGAVTKDLDDQALRRP